MSDLKPGKAFQCGCGCKLMGVMVRDLERGAKLVHIRHEAGWSEVPGFVGNHAPIDLSDETWAEYTAWLLTR